MTTTDMTAWEIRSLRAQIRDTEQKGDVEGAASLAWQLVDALDDADDAAVAPQAPAVEIRWVQDADGVDAIGLAYVGGIYGVQVAAALRQTDASAEYHGGLSFLLTTTRVGRDGIEGYDGSNPIPGARVYDQAAATAWLTFMAGLVAGTVGA